LLDVKNNIVALTGMELSNSIHRRDLKLREKLLAKSGWTTAQYAAVPLSIGGTKDGVVARRYWPYDWEQGKLGNIEYVDLPTDIIAEVKQIGCHG
jgi:hypothetical protein